MVFKLLVGIVIKIVNVRLFRVIRCIFKIFVFFWQQCLIYLKYLWEEQGEFGEFWDYIQMMVCFVEKYKQDEMCDWDFMVKWMIVVNFGVMYNIVFQVINMMVNVLSFDVEYNIIVIFCEEFDCVIGCNF